MKDGYDVTFVVDAIGGRSQLTHQTAIQRLAHAGAVPATSLALVTEMFRDWKSPLGKKAQEFVVPYYKELSGQLLGAGVTSPGVTVQIP